MKRYASKVIALVLTFCMIFTTAACSKPGAGEEQRELDALKVVEIYTKVDADTGKLVSDYIPTPREITDYHDVGTYGKAEVPYTVNELRLADEDAFTKYPDAKSKYAALTKAISDEVYDGIMKGQAVFFTGAEGDTAVGVAAGVRRAFPESKVGVVYLDAQGGLKTGEAETAETALATIMGIDDTESKVDLWNLAAEGGAAFDGLLLTDGRAMDEESKKNAEAVSETAAQYALLDTVAFKDAEQWKTAVAELADAVDAIYLHIDADVLHQAYVPHIEGVEAEGPIVWEVLDNLKAVMETEKVAAINLANMYYENTDVEHTTNGFTIPLYPVETDLERVNRFAMPSILNAVRMVSTMLEDWYDMPDADKAKVEIPEVEAVDTKLQGIKVVEILTRNETGGIFVGRRLAEDPESGYTWADRGKLREEQDNLYVGKVGTPRELDDWTLAGIYEQAGVPVRSEGIVLTDEDADEKYPDLTRYEALCKEVSDSVYEGVDNGDAVVVVGSGCMPVPAVAGGLRRAAGDDAKLGMIYIDAHGDINTMDSTFSGGIGGMDVSPTMGIDPHPTIQHWWEVCSDGGKPFDELLHACGRDLDKGTDTTDPNNPYEFGEMLNLQAATSDDKYILSVDDFNNEKLFDERLAEWIEGLDAVYLHIDMDALDGSFLPNGGSPVGYTYDPEKMGPSVWTVVDRIETIMETGKVSVVNLASTYGDPAYTAERLLRHGFVYPDVTGEDPMGEYARNRANTTAIMSGMRVLSSMVRNWEDYPQL